MKTYPKGLSVVPFENTTIARLYDTNIVTINHTDRTIILNTGGWNTKHTKKCMNVVLSQFDKQVYQEKFELYCSGTKFNNDGTLVVKF